MLTIRQEQIAILHHDRVADWIARFLQSAYPDHVGSWTPKVRSTFIESSIARARALRLRSAHEARLYTHAAFLLGSNFERNPSYPWANRILESSAAPAAKARMLEDMAVLEVERLARLKTAR